MVLYECRQVCFSYPHHAQPTLNGITLQLCKGEIVGLMGANGSGKTTLTKLLIGMLRPDSGMIRLEERPLPSYTLAEIGKHVGYVFQNPSQQLFCRSVVEEMMFYRRFAVTEIDDTVRERANYLLDWFELAYLRNKHPLLLSRGEQQRLAIAATLMHNPRFLILDEPESALDEQSREKLREYMGLVASSGVGVLLVSHDRQFCENIAHRVIKMDRGAIVNEAS